MSEEEILDFEDITDDDSIIDSNTESNSDTDGEESEDGPSNTLLEIYSDKRLPRIAPKTASESYERYKILMGYVLGENDLTDDERLLLHSEAIELKDFAAWKRGYSDIKDPETGEENYLLSIIPGGSFIDLSSEPKSKHIAQKRIYDDFVKRDLGRYYKYSIRMVETKMKIYQTMVEAVTTFVDFFAMYGKQCTFRCETDEGTIMVRWEDVEKIRDYSKRFLNEINYIVKARSTRRFPFHTDYLANRNLIGGKYVSIRQDVIDWIAKEKTLEYFREYFFNGETELGKGNTSLKALQLILRIALSNRVTLVKNAAGRKYYKYRATKIMMELLNVDEYISPLSIVRISKTMIIKSFDTDNKNEESILNTETATIQEYYDMIVDSKKQQRKK